MSVVSGTVFHADRNGNNVPYTKLHNRPLIAKNGAGKREIDQKMMIWFQNIQNLKEHVIISGSTSFDWSAIIDSRDVANNDSNTLLNPQTSQTSKRRNLAFH